ncbi:hypothetical protein D1164_14175 [Mariniphaga sediminis]|jgi:large-conductance mechanosensitive channel|uniref:Uncharacterized protein n=1 Tax=Mariniphaga sediminis TaxID=1628158 RepID=A0A399D1E3_9BACT|nr:hypothetical protein [Mariniphaga sediminis]RIH64501.1 hypothetical protein D1164_14175 [Mariniphaga sediminis]
MLQEIVTYLIVAFAVAVAARKIYYKLARKAPHTKASTAPDTSTASNENCAECVTECVLRHADPQTKKENAALCAKT